MVGVRLGRPGGAQWPPDWLSTRRAAAGRNGIGPCRWFAAHTAGQLAKTKLLILDDFELTPLSGRGRADLLELLDDQVGSGATIVSGR